MREPTPFNLVAFVVVMTLIVVGFTAVLNSILT